MPSPEKLHFSVFSIIFSLYISKNKGVHCIGRSNKTCVLDITGLQLLFTAC